MEEEIALLEEQLATAHADIDRLQGELADATARASDHESAAARARRELSEARRALAEREEAFAEKLSEIEALQAASTAAAGRYRERLLAAEPALPADLVSGDSVAEVDAAADRARQTVAQVRQHLEQQAQSIRVPAGAPARGAPDLSGLSPGEKIRAGLRDP